jgi:hypothetical protein
MRPGLSNRPQEIPNYDAWYYERRAGIEILREVRNDEAQFVRTDRFIIPWWMLRKSLARRSKSLKPAMPGKGRK